MSENIPQTLDEAFIALDVRLTEVQKRELAKTPENEAITNAHRELGGYIRNEWLRSGKSALAGTFHKLGARHFDDVSSIILTSYCRHLNKKPIELEAQGACFERWWKEQKHLEKEAKDQKSNTYKSPNFNCPDS